MSKRKQICLCMLCGLVIAISASVTEFEANCAAIRDNVFRLHIIANSDSEADQNIKLEVRNAVLAMTKEMYEDCKTKEDAKYVTVQNLKALESAANTVLKQAGFMYTAHARIGTVNFNTREYEQFTLPAGAYEAFEIVLGAGEGKNWWCVMYPKVCLSVCGTDAFDTALDNDQNEIVTEKNKYKVAFRFMEIFDDIKRFIKKYI